MVAQMEQALRSHSPRYSWPLVHPQTMSTDREYTASLSKADLDANLEAKYARLATKFQMELNKIGWLMGWLNMQTCTKSLTVRKTAIKLISRWYYTLWNLSKIYPQVSPNCFRGCIYRGSFLHLFWECKHLQHTWKAALELLDTLAGGHVALTYTHCLLFEGLPDTPKPSYETDPLHMCSASMGYCPSLEVEFCPFFTGYLPSRQNNII